jgi:FSR family fosmidomycin resistance protein-like MFS transporter
MARISLASMDRTVHNRALTVIALTALGHFALELVHSFLPVVYPLLQERLSLNYAQIGAVALASTSAVTLAQPLFGHLSDRWDPRRVTGLSIVWLSLLIGLVGFVWSYPSLLMLVILAGFGSAAFHPAAAAVASYAARAHRRKGAAMSIFSVGGNLGAALSPLLMAVVLNRFGLIGTPMVMPVGVTIGVILLLQLRGDRGRSSPTLDDGNQELVRVSALGLALVVLAAMARSWFQVTLMTYLPTWLHAQGHSLVYGGQVLFVFSVSVGGGSLLGGILSDRVGRWPVMLVSLALLAPAFWIFLAAGGWLQTFVAAGMGLLIGCTFPVAVVMAQEVWPRGAGFASGVVMGLGWWPGGVGASFTGWLADRIGLDGALPFLLAPPLIGAAAMLAFAIWSQGEDSPSGKLHS